MCVCYYTAARQTAGRIYNWLRREIRERLIQQRIDLIERQGQQQTQGRKIKKGRRDEYKTEKPKEMDRWNGKGMKGMKSSATPFERRENPPIAKSSAAAAAAAARRRSSLRLARRRPKTFNQIDRQVADQIMSRVSPASFDSPPFLPPLHGCCCHNTTTTTMAPSLPYLAAPSLSIRLSFISQRDGRAEKADRWGPTERERKDKESIREIDSGGPNHQMGGGRNIKKKKKKNRRRRRLLIEEVIDQALDCREFRSLSLSVCC